MDQNQKDQEFRKMADTFITLANEHCDSTANALVGSTLLYATARFSAFVVASHAKNEAHYEAEIDNAVEYFGDEFKRMLVENLEQYRSVFKET